MNFIEIKNNIGNPYDQGQDICSTIQKTELTRTFFIDEYPVTAAYFKAVSDWANNNGYNFNIGFGDGNKPITMVNWFDCLKWCNALSELDKLTPVYNVDGSLEAYKSGNKIPNCDLDADGYRLPLEAEFEYAARAEGKDAGNIFAGQGIDKECCKYVNIKCEDPDCKICTEQFNNETNCRMKEIEDVGQREPNSLGIYDMSGNILQWCFDDMINYNNIGTISNPISNNNKFRCVRGCAAIYSDFYNKTSSRQCCNIKFRLPNLGFRVVRTKT